MHIPEFDFWQSPERGSLPESVKLKNIVDVIDFNALLISDSNIT